MKTLQAGSTLMIVIIMSGMLVSAITVLWRSSLFRTDITCLRERSYRQMYSAHAFIRLAIALCKKEYDQCYATIGHEEVMVLACDAWPLATDTTCQAIVYARHVEHGIALRATIACKRQIVHTVYCVVHHLANDQGDEHSNVRCSITQWRDVYGSL